MQISDGQTECNSRFGGISKSEGNLNAFLKKKLATSYDYMLLQTHFDSYQKNRPGFKKLFNGLSDQSWDETVALIKHVTKRGGVVDFSGFGREQLSAIGGKKLEVDELHALAIALDSEKQLGNDAIKVHQHASHMNHKDDGDWYDPELTQFMEEKFLEKQASTIRTLSGYANDLKRLM
uniref:Ferritin n=1 Tax=Megaselia scalaris TaxID=36166 RepID=T1GUI8_MEGSC